MDRRRGSSLRSVIFLILATVALLGLTSCQFLVLNTGEGPEIGDWVLTKPLSEARSGHAGIVYMGRLFVTGGSFSIGVYFNDVMYAATNAYGAVSSWNAASSFPIKRSDHGSAAYNNYLYVLGGSAGAAPFSDVQYAFVNPDGSLNSWTSTTPFPISRENLACFVYNGRLYVAGGDDGSMSAIKDVSFAKLGSVGSVDGSWVPTTSMTTPRRSFTAVAYNGYLYAIGGHNSGALSSVEYAPIFTTTGLLGTWKATTSLPSPLYGHASALYNGYVYVIGGHDGTGEVDEVRYAKINGDGTLSGWKTTTPLPSARWGHVAVKNGINVYVIGGTNSSPSRLSEVLYAQFQ